MAVSKKLWGYYPTTPAWLPVKVDSSGRIVIDATLLFEDTPTDGETKKGPTSNWAYDHENNASAHHAKYTDAEALAAAVQAGAITDGVTKAPTHDAVYDIKVTADGAIAKSLLTTRGDIIYRDATQPARLPKGSSGQVLTMGANDPAWQTPSAGAATASGSYSGNNTANRAVAHGLGTTPKLVIIICIGTLSAADAGHFIINSGAAAISAIVYASATTTKERHLSVTAIDDTNFYVGNASGWGDSANASSETYYWFAVS